jgi:hypothetical protein
MSRSWEVGLCGRCTSGQYRCLTGSGRGGILPRPLVGIGSKRRLKIQPRLWLRHARGDQLMLYACKRTVLPYDHFVEFGRVAGFASPDNFSPRPPPSCCAWMSSAKTLVGAGRTTSRPRSTLSPSRCSASGVWRNRNISAASPTRIDKDTFGLIAGVAQPRASPRLMQTLLQIGFAYRRPIARSRRRTNAADVILAQLIQNRTELIISLLGFRRITGSRSHRSVSGVLINQAACVNI